MGDHPIAWTRCLGNGRAFYAAIGRRPESYIEPDSLEILTEGVAWAAGGGAEASASSRLQSQASIESSVSCCARATSSAMA